MTINNPEAFMGGVWDWAILDGCFGATKIKPTDIDGCVERHGKVLYMETKRPGANVHDAQKYLHRAWVRKGDSVLIIWGEQNKPQHIQVLSPRYPPPEGKTYKFASVEKLRELVAAWFKKVDGSP